MKLFRKLILHKKLKKLKTPSQVKKEKLKVYMEYEHKGKDGALKSKGEVMVDKQRNTHIIQRDARGKMVAETIKDRKGKIIKDTKY